MTARLKALLHASDSPFQDDDSVNAVFDPTPSEDLVWPNGIGSDVRPSRPAAAAESVTGEAAVAGGLAATSASLSGAGGGGGGSDATGNSSVNALAVNTARTDYAQMTGNTLNGAGLKIGILSDSFNLSGGEAADIADGDLPDASMIHILKEGGSGADEGRAMAELVHQIAPAAQLYFYSGTNSESDFANGINTLVGAGVNVIVDDVFYNDEPFYQDSGQVTQAAEKAVAAGVDYFTNANNSGPNYYEAAFSPIAGEFALPGIGMRVTHDVNGGSPYEAITLAANATLDFTMQWTQPYGGNQYDIGVGLFSYDSASQSYTMLNNFASTGVTSEPVLSISQSVSTPVAGTYYLAFYEASGTATPGTFKIIFFQGTTGTVDGYGSGTGSGALIGHEMAPGVNAVAAVNVADTPSQGVPTPKVEPYSAPGSGVTYYDGDGAALPTPSVDHTLSFAATDGTPTSVFAPFDGTSAAVANAAGVDLLLQQADSRLEPAQVTYLLAQSATPTSTPLTGGAGLIQADPAVKAAVHAAETPIWTGQGGSTSWSDAANWSDNAAVDGNGPVQISDGLGLFTGAYQVSFDEASDTVASLVVDGGGVTAADPALTVQDGDVLTTGSLTVGAGSVAIAGTLADTGALLAGSVAGAITLDATASLVIAGAAADVGIAFSGAGGHLAFGAADGGTLESGLAADITGFGSGDVLDLSGLAVSSVAGVNVSGTNITVVGGGGQTLAELTLSGDFTRLGFMSDGNGGTDIVACYAEGTRIAVPGGERPVETLREGDRLLTASGRVRRVHWLGRRSYPARIVAANPGLRPVRFRAGSLGGGLPRRDLLVSPEHAMLLDGRLVPARFLLNGDSIVQDWTGGDVRYVHVELGTHDVILAEGAASETFLEDGNRGIFHNAAEFMGVCEPAVPDTPYCAPRLESGFELDAIRRRLRAVNAVDRLAA